MLNRGEAYERVAPPQCSECEDTLFNRRGRVGLWDGSLWVGYIYEAACLNCGAVFRSNSDPKVVKEEPWSMTWYRSKTSSLPDPGAEFDITNLSLRARLAVALRIFATYCDERSLSHPDIDRYLDYLWEFIGQYGGSGSPSCRWIKEEPSLIQAGLGYSYQDEFEAALREAEVSITTFRKVLVSTTKVLYSSLYGAADEKKSSHYMQKLELHVGSMGVPLVDTRIFNASRWSDNNGWGNVPSGEELATWRGLFLRHDPK
ncbi:hypothetical protein [Singulisphaera sp. PoT]|uniref:hypothetical protein n=1 Tax=Singulisphaera sp. PoT TaxID=3411797 RepID=UPI003BF52C3B